MALYVDITCPYCCEQFESTAASVSKNKGHVCTAHLAKKKCDLPKNERGGVDASILALAPSKQARTSVVIHKACKEQYDELKQESAEMKERLSKLEAKTNMYDNVLTEVLPSLKLPLIEEVAPLQLREAISKDSPQAPIVVSTPEPSLEVKLERAKRVLESKDFENEGLRKENSRLKGGTELAQQRRIGQVLSTKCSQQRDLLDRMKMDLRHLFAQKEAGNVEGHDPWEVYSKILAACESIDRELGVVEPDQSKKQKRSRPGTPVA